MVRLRHSEQSDSDGYTSAARAWTYWFEQATNGELTFDHMREVEHGGANLPAIYGPDERKHKWPVNDHRDPEALYSMCWCGQVQVLVPRELVGKTTQSCWRPECYAMRPLDAIDINGYEPGKDWQPRIPVAKPKKPRYVPKPRPVVTYTPPVEREPVDHVMLEVQTRKESKPLKLPKVRSTAPRSPGLTPEQLRAALMHIDEQRWERVKFLCSLPDEQLLKYAKPGSDSVQAQEARARGILVD